MRVNLLLLLLPHDTSDDVCVPTYYLLAMSEASANLTRYNCVRYGVRDPFVVGTTTTKTKDAGKTSCSCCGSSRTLKGFVSAVGGRK